MDLRKWALGPVVFVLGAAAATAANAQSQTAIERSGNVFHRAVCAHGNQLGTARCFAHVVTDARGEEKDGKSGNLNPLAVPSGYGPSDLRAAYKITTNGTTTIAIVDANGYSNAESDLAVYRAQYGLPACTTANGCFKKSQSERRSG